MSTLGHDEVAWLIEKLRDELNTPDLNNSLKSDIETLISVLSCPVFSSLVTIQGSVDELKAQLQKHPSILPVDFDISPLSGELLINTSTDAPSKFSIQPHVEPAYAGIRHHQQTTSLQRVTGYEANRYSHLPGQQIRNQQQQQQPHSKQFNQEQRHQQQLVKSSQQQQSFPSSSFESTSLSTSNPLSSNTYPLEPAATCTTKTLTTGITGPSEQMVLNSDWAEVETIDLINDGTGLGFGMVGGKSSGVIIKQIIPGGAADRDARMKPGDHLLSIAEVSLRGMNSEQVAQVLRNQGTGIVRLIVARSIDPPAAVINAAVNAAGSASIVAPTGPHSAIVPTRILSDMEETQRHLALAAASSPLSSTDADTSTHTADSELLAVPPPGFGDELPPESATSPTSSQGAVKIPIKSTFAASSCSSASASSTSKEPSSTLPFARSHQEPSALDCDLSSLLPPPPSHGSFALSPVAVGRTDALLAEDTEELPEMDTFEVELVKDHQGLGITIAGYVCEKEEISGIFVKSIAPGSAADMSRKIAINDQIIEVDGKSLFGFNNHQAVEVLRHSGKVVHLRLARYLRGSKYEQLKQAIASDVPNPPSSGASHVNGSFACSSKSGTTGTTSSSSPLAHTSIIPDGRVAAPTNVSSPVTSSVSSEHQITYAQLTHPSSAPGLVTVPSDVDSDMDMPPPPPPIALPTVPRSNSTLANTTHHASAIDSANNRDAHHQHHTYRSLNEFSSYPASTKPSSGTRVNVSQSQLQREWAARLPADQIVLVAQIEKCQETGGLGISLEGTVDTEGSREVRSHHYIRTILPDGPVGREGTLKAGDEILQVDGRELTHMNHIEVVSLLKDLPRSVEMVCTRSIKNIPASSSSSGKNVLSTSNVNYGQYADYSSAKNSANNSGNNHKQLINIQSDQWIDQPDHPDLMKKENVSPISQGISSSTSADRLVKAKSDGSLAIIGMPLVDATAIAPEDALRVRSRSLEPLTGLAMWSSEPITIHLMKGDRGLGFSILDYQDPMDPSETVIVVRSLVPGGVAQLDGHLIPGDRLISVNGYNLENATLDEAVTVLKGAPKGDVSIGIAKPLPLPECDSVLSSELRSGIDPDHFTLSRK